MPPCTCFPRIQGGKTQLDVPPASAKCGGHRLPTKRWEKATMVAWLAHTPIDENWTCQRLGLKRAEIAFFFGKPCCLFPLCACSPSPPRAAPVCRPQMEHRSASIVHAFCARATTNMRPLIHAAAGSLEAWKMCRNVLLPAQAHGALAHLRSSTTPLQMSASGAPTWPTRPTSLMFCVLLVPCCLRSMCQRIR